MERVQQIFKIELMNETYMLSAKEFTQFQRECREIAGYGEPIFYPVPAYENKTKEQDLAEQPVNKVIEDIQTKRENRLMEQALEQDEVQPLIEPMEEVAILDFEITTEENIKLPEAFTIQVHNDKLKELINTVPKKPKDAKIQKYVAMHEAGVDMIAIKNAMLKDKVCAESSLPYFAKKILAESTKVTKIVDYAGKTDDQIIEELKQKNKDRVEDRQKPRASKG